MSARAPFIPNTSRPASRAAHLQDKSSQKSNKAPDLSNPLHADQGPTKDDSSAISADDNGSKPLNTASVLKTLKFKNVQRRQPSMEGAAARAPTVTMADPTFNGIAAPVPRPAQARPSSPGAFTPQNMFRLPALPPPDTAHIPASSLPFSFSGLSSASAPAPASASEQQHHPSHLPSPPKSTRPRLFNLKPSENTEDRPHPPFSLNLPVPNQTGPQRVLLNPIDHSSELTDARRPTRTNSNSTNLKRPHDDTDHADAHLKRYRSRGDTYAQQRHKPTNTNTNTTPSSPLASSNPSHSRGPTPDAMQDPRSYQHPPQHRLPQSPLTPPPQQQISDTFSGSSRALDRLLGRSVDDYVDEHVDQYERAMERWKSCTMEEWVAGADEQAARFTKIFEFAKDHMLSKMRLFAGFDSEVARQNGVLTDREKMLEGVKAQLVQESANVLGGGSVRR